MFINANPVSPASLHRGYSDFITRCEGESYGYSLTPDADVSSYASCFSIFGRHLLRSPVDSRAAARFVACLRAALQRMRGSGDVLRGKPYRQLLVFSLSALAALGQLETDPLPELIKEQLPIDIEKELIGLGCLAGKPGSGNQAMFLAIFLLHARDRLGVDTNEQINQWVELHQGAMNRFGFWGPDKGMTHLQFQNGYHQYEIFEYLGIQNPRKEEAMAAVRSLVDPQGHFAPYPGGGGCYDYDAVFILTPDGKIPDAPTRALLLRTAETLKAEQRPDGGFSESLYIRPRSLANLARFASHIAHAAGNGPLFLERLRYALTLQRPRHNRIHTHWSRYSRRWDESDLWDSWFRMMTLARIEVALDPSAASRWGFVDYPGIGYHPILRRQAVAEV